MPRCTEPGCNNKLHKSDLSRYPGSLSRPVHELGDQRAIQKLDMRSRCSDCYDSKYKGQYSATSYKWSHDSSAFGIPLKVYNEAGEDQGYETIPTYSNSMVDTMLNQDLFFQDTINTESGHRVENWSMGNVFSTYGNCKNLLCFENPSDRRVGGQQLHLAGDRNRGSSLNSDYCSRERWIANTQKIPVTWYNGSGGTTTNLDRLGSRDGSNPYSTYQKRLLLTETNTSYLTPDMTSIERDLAIAELVMDPPNMGAHMEEVLSAHGLYGFPSRDRQTDTFDPSSGALGSLTDALDTLSVSSNAYTDTFDMSSVASDTYSNYGL